jgi:hypothetical protein
MKKLCESAIERPCCNWAKSVHGINNLKLANLIGIPDRILLYKGRVLFVEFKAPGEEPRPAQLFIHKWLRENGFLVFVIDNRDQFKTIIENWIKDAK